jgi:hypothetical protein
MSDEIISLEQLSALLHITFIAYVSIFAENQILKYPRVNKKYCRQRPVHYILKRNRVTPKKTPDSYQSQGQKQ